VRRSAVAASAAVRVVDAFKRPCDALIAGLTAAAAVDDAL
jgi:hypothetical protein